MGAGTSPAGMGPAGFEPVVVPADTPPSGLTPVQFYAQARGVKTPLVLLYDPSVQGFVQNTDGTFQGVHPIDQELALAVFIPYGSIPSAPTVGSKFTTCFNRVSPNRVQSIGRSELNRCTASLLARKAIVILSFTVAQNANGRFQPVIGYTNLLDPRYNPQNPALAGRVLQAKS